jgi:hypothetical protein
LLVRDHVVKLLFNVSLAGARGSQINCFDSRGRAVSNTQHIFGGHRICYWNSLNKSLEFKLGNIDVCLRLNFVLRIFSVLLNEPLEFFLSILDSLLNILIVVSFSLGV